MIQIKTYRFSPLLLLKSPRVSGNQPALLCSSKVFAVKSSFIHLDPLRFQVLVPAVLAMSFSVLAPESML
jgi:hypothetical protein